MTQFISKIKKGISFLDGFIDTPYFACFLAFFELLSYYLGLDLLIIGLISISIAFTFLFKKNFNCLFVIFLFMSSMISLKNSPANQDINSNFGFYFNSSVYIACIIFVAIPVFTVFLKAIKNILDKKISIDLLLIATLFFGYALLANGIFRSDYNSLNALFGVFMYFFFVVLFIAIKPYMKVDKESLELISKQVSIYLIVPLVELIVFYLTMIIKSTPIIPRENPILLGWGNRNTIGMIFIITIPLLIPLIDSKTKKSLFRYFAIVLIVLCTLGIVLSFSRQAYLAFVIFTFIYLLYLFVIKIKKKKVKIFSLSFLLALFISFTLLFIFVLKDYFLNNSTGRVWLWSESWDAFLKFPIFGGGFFFLGGDSNIGLYKIMPFTVHNTMLELLGTCGIFGLFAYLFYRVVTIKTIVKAFSLEKIYFLMSLFLFLLLSLVDIHIFDFFGTAVYVVVISLLMHKNEQNAADLIFVNVEEQLNVC